MIEPKTTIVVRTRALFGLLAVGAVIAALAPPRAHTQPAPHPVVERYEGRYENRASDGGASIIKEAIDSGTRSMRRVRRNVARRRLRAVNPPVPSLIIAPNGEGVRIDYEGSRANRTPRLGVFAENRSAAGGKVDVRHDVVGGRLHETYRQKDGGAVNVFLLSRDRRELSLVVTVESGRLPKPIVYELEFLRAD